MILTFSSFSNIIQREKKFPFKPSLSPFTERLAVAIQAKKESQDLDPKTRAHSAKKKWEQLYSEAK